MPLVEKEHFDGPDLLQESILQFPLRLDKGVLGDVQHITSNKRVLFHTIISIYDTDTNNDSILRNLTWGTFSQMLLLSTVLAQ